MAITHQASNVSSAIAGAASITFAHNAGTGTDRALVVGVGYSSASRTVTATYNSVAMTSLWSQHESTASSGGAAFKLAAPSTGSNNVVVTFSASVDIGAAGASTHNGVDQTTVNRTAYTATGTGSGAPSVTVADSQSGDVVIDAVTSFVNAITAGTGQTSRAEDDAIAGGSHSFGMSTESATGANTVMSWTGGTFWVIGATALIPAGASGGTTFTKIAGERFGLAGGRGLAA
jgi:hypothetical protein